MTRLLYYGAAWCGPCKTTKPELVKFEEAHPEVEVVRFEQTKDARPFTEAGIQSIPTFVLESSGQEVGRWVGGSTLKRIEREVESVLG